MPGLRERFRRAIIRPRATAALALVLACDLALMALARTERGPLHAWGPSERSFSADAYARRADRAAVIFDSWGEAARLLMEEPETTMRFEAVGSVRRRGLWAPTVRRSDLTIRQSYGNRFSPAEARAARESLVAQLVARGWVHRDLAGALASDDVAEQRILMAGVAHNAASLGIAGLLAMSLGWVRPAIARARRRRALARGRCPACGYSLAGLEDPACPECGSPTAD